MRAIRDFAFANPGVLRAVACENPSQDRTEAEEMLALVKEAGLHGYLENQLPATAVARGKAILWERAASVSGAALYRKSDRGTFRPARALGSGKESGKAVACCST